MKIGDSAYGGIYAGAVNGHHIICSPIEYDLPCTVSWSQANEYCKSIGMELPSKGELNCLYKLFKTRPEYCTKWIFHWYWTSTTSSPTAAWTQNFYNGQQSTNIKASRDYVRPIKRIKI